MMTDPTVYAETQAAVQEAQEAVSERIIDTTGETVETTTTPAGWQDTADSYISDIAPPGGTLRTWGPPIALGLVVLGAVWWLRK